MTTENRLAKGGLRRQQASSAPDAQPAEPLRAVKPKPYADKQAINGHIPHELFAELHEIRLMHKISIVKQIEEALQDYVQKMRAKEIYRR